MDASIVIPTKNGGARFADVLDMTLGQVTDYSFEVICVDSGSSDGTLEVIASRPFVTLYQIRPDEFGHGKTRTWAAGKCSGDYIVFITQDALPATEFWLQSFIDAMKSNPDVIAGFGAHIPYPNCNLFDKRDITRHFQQIGVENTVIEVDDLDRFKVDVSYRMGFAFFSDNNACVKRDYFMRYPYPDVDFAEDQFWMLEKMGWGEKKVYCPGAAVYHSHNYGFIELLQRSYDEHKALRRLFEWNPVPDGRRIPQLTLQASRRDWDYIRSLDLSPLRKGREGVVAVFRNAFKFLGAHEGAVYDEVSSDRQARMDMLFSQYRRQVSG